MTVKTPQKTISELLALHITEEELYESYFKKELWSITELAALMSGISPEKLNTIHERQTGDARDFEHYKCATDIQRMVLDAIENDLPIKHFFPAEEGIALSPWRFIKWLAIKQVPLKIGFFRALPLYLIELYEEFQPINSILMTCPKWRREYHRALYLKHAEEIVLNSKKRMTRNEIWNHPQLKLLQNTFKGQNGDKATYSKRTITESWLRAIDPKKRGRPRKQKKKAQTSSKNTVSTPI